jgi:hypothetical protein
VSIEDGFCSRLTIPLAEFKRGLHVFDRPRVKLGSNALLAYEGGFLSIESGEATAVMHASGNWHGRATFSPNVLRAIVTVPPRHDPVLITYANGRLNIGGTSIPCTWQTASQPLINNLENPSLLELLALERTIPRSEMKGSPLGRRIRDASARANKRIEKASALLLDLGVTENEIRELIEKNIAARIKDHSISR